MGTRALGNTGISVSAHGSGAAGIDGFASDRQAFSQLLNAALDAGLTVIDTAE